MGMVGGRDIIGEIMVSAFEGTNVLALVMDALSAVKSGVLAAAG